MKKIVLSVLTSLLMFSCGNNTNNAKEGTDSIIKIGVPEPLTGEISQYGIAIKEGIELKIEQVNELGGINGVKVEMISEDTKGDNQENQNIVKKMISEYKVNALLGESISANSLTVAELAQKAGLPMITPAGTRFDITEGKDHVFRTTFTDPYQGEILANYLKEKGYKNVAILTNTSVDYSVGVVKRFKEVANEIGLSYVEQKYTKDDKDFKSLLTNIKNQENDALLLPDYYNTVGLILNQAKEMDLKVQVFGSDGWDGIERDFANVAEGSVFVTQFFVEDENPQVQDFVKAYREKFKKEPTLFSALGYDAASLLLKVYENVDYKDYPAVVEGLKNSKMDLVTGYLEFDANRNPNKKVTFVTIKNGKTVLVDKY